MSEHMNENWRVECPLCHAGEGKPCRTRRTAIVTAWAHGARFFASKRAGFTPWGWSNRRDGAHAPASERSA